MASRWIIIRCRTSSTTHKWLFEPQEEDLPWCLVSGQSAAEEQRKDVRQIIAYRNENNWQKVDSCAVAKLLLRIIIN